MAIELKHHKIVIRSQYEIQKAGMSDWLNT